MDSAPTNTIIYHKSYCYWNDDDIDQILETLEKENVKLTFFMVGDFVEKYSESVKKIANAGHEIRKSFFYTSTC